MPANGRWDLTRRLKVKSSCTKEREQGGATHMALSLIKHAQKIWTHSVLLQWDESNVYWTAHHCNSWRM